MGDLGPFVERFGKAFGRSQSLMLRLAGLLEAETEGDGAIVLDASGGQWVDFGSFGVHLLGHRHPSIVRAAQAQLDRLGLSTKVLGNEASTQCAEGLLRTLPEHIDRAVLSNTGSEAVEIALKLAIGSSGRNRFISLKGSYHGKTLGALAVSDSSDDRFKNLRPFDVAFVEREDVQGLERLLASRPTAALIVEPTQGEGGIVRISDTFLAAARKLTEANGALLISDEVQTGLGRCGTVWQSPEAMKPDIVVAGKILSGGLVPLAATCFSSAAISERANDPLSLASTYAGGALAGAVGAAVVENVTTPAFLDRVQQLGATAQTLLKARLGRSPVVADVRCYGLMIGVELRTPELTGRVILKAAERGLLLTFCLHKPSVLRIYPPACMDEQQLTHWLNVACEAIELSQPGGR